MINVGLSTFEVQETVTIVRHAVSKRNLRSTLDLIGLIACTGLCLGVDMGLGVLVGVLVTQAPAIWSQFAKLGKPK
jgi:hypothetical protein